MAQTSEHCFINEYVMIGPTFLSQLIIFKNLLLSYRLKLKLDGYKHPPHTNMDPKGIPTFCMSVDFLYCSMCFTV